MQAIMLLVALLCAPLLIWGMVNPKSMWEVLGSWQYKDPEKNRPSDASFTVTRFSSGCALVFLIAMIPITWSLVDQSQEQQEREQYEECLDENDDEDSLLSPEEWCENLDPDNSDEE